MHNDIDIKTVMMYLPRNENKKYSERIAQKSIIKTIKPLDSIVI